MEKVSVCLGTRQISTFKGKVKLAFNQMNKADKKNQSERSLSGYPLYFCLKAKTKTKKQEQITSFLFLRYKGEFAAIPFS